MPRKVTKKTAKNTYPKSKTLDWKIRVGIIFAGIAVMVASQAYGTILIFVGGAIAQFGIWYGSNGFMSFIKNCVNKIWTTIKNYLPPF